MPGDGENRWYRPDERWPRHRMPYFRDALDHARAHGWHFKKLSNHSFGRVYCRRPEDGDHCKYRVDSTGRGGENAARDLHLQVDQCPHGGTSPNNATTLEHLVVKAEKLTNAAAALIDENRQAERAKELYADAEAEDLLDQAEDRADEVMRLVSEAIEAESEALAAREEGATMLADTDVPPGERAPAVLNAAERTAGSASKALRREPTSPWVKDLRQRVRLVRERISQLRDQIKSNPLTD